MKRGLKSEKKKMGTAKVFCLLLVMFFGVQESLEKASCPRPVNVLFLLKSSKNDDNHTFLLAKRLINQIADSFPVLPKQIDMAVILMGSLNASVTVQFGQNNTNHFKQKVDKLEDGPFVTSYDEMFDKAIPYAARAVVVITTGDDDMIENPTFIDAVRDIKEANTSHIFVVQLTEGQDLRRLLDIATDYDLIFNVKDLLMDSKQQDKFYFQICASFGDIRLVGPSLNRGFLEVYRNRTWSPVQVFNPTWNNRLTDFICHRLGFKVNASVGNISDSVLSFLTNKTCGTENSSIASTGCGKIEGTVYRNCTNRSSCLYIVCQVPLRLSGPPSRPYIGIAEVFYLGTWGTVCSDTFNKHGANIVCQNFGYREKALMTFVDVSNNISTLPEMLMSIYCYVERGHWEQHCKLTRCGRKCATTCRTRPASVLCDNSSVYTEKVKTFRRNVGPKISISCTMPNVRDVKWYYENGQERREITRNGNRIKFTIRDTKVSELIIKQIILEDGGAYFCETSSRREMIFLYIKADEKVKRKQYFYPGKDGRLKCCVTGSPPPSLEWRKNGTVMGLEKGDLWKNVLQEDGTLLIKNISTQDVGEYECKCKQETGGTEDHQRIMIQLLLYDKPQTKIFDPNRTVENGKSVYLRCYAYGRPEPNVTWYKNDTAIPINKYFQEPSGKGIVVRLNIPTVTNRDYGMYTCTAQNAAGINRAFAWITQSIDPRMKPILNSSNNNNDLPLEWQLLTAFFVTLVVVGAIGLVVWFIRRKRKENSQPGKMSELFVVSSKSCDIWELPKGSLHLQKTIGKGMFGEVWKAVALNKSNNKDNSSKEQIVAVKKPRDDRSDVQKQMLKQEIAVNKSLAGKKHTNTVNFLGCITSDDMVMMVIEFVPYGDLLGYLRESRGIKDKFYYHCEELPRHSEISPYELFSFATQIACGMSFLAENQIIHRDLAARNVLVGENLVCKITDFGLAKVVKDGNGYMGSRKGRLPIKWTAPEVFFGDANITSQSDVWSYGITLYEIFTIGGDPYPGKGEWDIVYKIRTDKYIMPKPEHISEEIYEIMVSCWRRDPKERPTFHELHKQLTNMVETDHYLELDMTKYQSHMYANLEDMEDDLDLLI